FHHFPAAEMEAPLLSMVTVSSPRLDSAPLRLPPVSSSPPSIFGHHHDLCTPLWADCRGGQSGMEVAQRQLQPMERYEATSYAPECRLPADQMDSEFQPSATASLELHSTMEMPRGSVDSAISMVASAQRCKLKQVGLYTMHEKIGTGMYGAVRRAVHKVTKTEVAIKIVKKEALRPYKNAMMRVYREIEVQKRLNHPFVLDIFQVMETESTIYLVTELCQGGELFNLIQKKRRMTEPEARKYFCQLLTAVQYCHERGVVHRDIKAENLLLDEFGNVKLADFGFSNFYNDSSLLGTFCGSPQYAAPEVFLGKKYYGPQLDIWSMGVVLHVFLTGRTPFEGRNFAHIQDQVLNAPIEYPFYVPYEAAQLMNLMMNRNVSQRATLRQVMNHRWLRHNEIPRLIKNSVAIYDYIVDYIPKDFTREILHELGIIDRQFRESEGRFDNVDGMKRLLVKEYRARRLRKVWADSNTVNIVVAAQVLQSEGRKRLTTVTKIDAEPIKRDLDVREAKINEDDENKVYPWCSFLPGPEEYPYREFQEEEQKEIEENEREREAKSVDSCEEYGQSTLKVDDSIPQGIRSAEIPNFEEAQRPAPARIEKNLQSVDSSEGYGGTGETSARSILDPSLTSMAQPDLKRMPSDVCSRMGALDISQKRRSVAETGEQPPLPKRPSLPECLSGEGMERGALKLAEPPRKQSERKTFFEMMRLKRKKAHAHENGHSATRPNWFLPAPPLPEGGSFDDADETKDKTIQLIYAPIPSIE
ncbi:hypothetical protein PENTCL1PPCAC_29419, partial [Pristionchus entomophagus]